MNRAYLKELTRILKQKRPSKTELSKLKIKLCSKHKVREIPSDIQISLHLDEKDLKSISRLLQTKPVRSLSGVSVCAVMTKPRRCPHGKCIYCPGGPASYFGDVPQSYTGKEPATRRAIRNRFDPYLQVFNRLEQYIVSGHLPEKLEIIIMGGTFPAYPLQYQDSFVKYLFKAMNAFSRKFFPDKKLDLNGFKEFFELPGKLDDKKREASIRRKVLALKQVAKTSLEKEQRKNERTKIRCVGLTIETRPDYATLSHANLMLRLGCTRVELGVQTLDNEVLRRVERGHSIAETICATRTLRDLGFKINYHIMPGLPGSTPRKDLENFHRLFTGESFRPDMLKIYPCMVLPGTKLHSHYKQGKYRPLTTTQAAKLIIKMKKMVPDYVRVMRVQRDIPTSLTEAGVQMTNLRQHIAGLMKNMNLKCRCIRCRESGQVIRARKLKPEIDIRVQHYAASAGTDFFVSAEDTKNNLLIGFCRLRFPSQQLRKEISENAALIRELHIYSASVPLGKKSVASYQHKGIGKMLLAEAEELARTYWKDKMVVISGVGAREYFRKLGYRRDGPYMAKKL